MGINRSKLIKPANSIYPVGFHLARVINIYDGDTITAAIVHCNKVFEYNLRLEGIDTPELKYKGLNKSTENSNSPDIIELKKLREKGFESRNRLIELINNCPDIVLIENNKLVKQKLIYVDCIKKEKYGRLLVTIYQPISDCCFMKPDKKSFNEILIEEGFAKSYDGGAK